MKTVARYDGLADWYDNFVRSEEVVSVALGSLEGMIGRGPGQCLDVGCGTGMAFATLAAHDWTVVGVDVSADQLAVAQDRAQAVGARLVHAEASQLPFPDGSFDAVVSLLTHTDFDDVSEVVRECARVVAPGGRFVYVGVHPCFVGPMVERRADGPHLLHPGYRRSGWWPDAPGVIRSQVGVNHVPLAQLINAVLYAGLRLEQIEEPGEEGYPMLLSLRAIRPSAPASK
ncbi:MAG: class I SAM-dependent methyltransferase [Chloroflexota bacterium]|nr:class I SAM-dependent methyltransferase [Chloroflexota bacterium]